MIYHNTKAFVYNPEKRVFVGEISELTEGGKAPLFCQIYPDAADRGFVLVSQKTGKEIKMYISGTEYNEEDLIAYYLEPCDPKERTFTITIFND